MSTFDDCLFRRKLIIAIFLLGKYYCFLTFCKQILLFFKNVPVIVYLCLSGFECIFDLIFVMLSLRLCFKYIVCFGLIF